MLSDVMGLLRCPHCAGCLTLAARAVSCTHGHSFDIARQGYVSLLPGDARVDTADTPEMVGARDAFLGAGHYAAIARMVAKECSVAVSERPGPVVEVGAGTAYYLAQTLDRLPGRMGLALDISKHAARLAARAHQRIGVVVCDAWQPLPVRTACAAAVLSVFSPRNPAEIRRVLAPGGALLLVTPTRRHLAELIHALGLLTVDAHKEARLEEQLGSFFSSGSQSAYEVAMSLSHEDAEHLVGMGPSARHADPAAIRRQLATLPDPLTVTASVTVSVYRPR